MNTTVSYLKRAIGLIVVGFVFALTMLVGITQAKAESPNILVGPDLTLGSSGQSVVVLQGLLSELGYMNLPASTPLGYFGPMTKNAVAQYQTSLGVSPTAGYFGSLTKTAMHAQLSQRGWLNLLGW